MLSIGQQHSEVWTEVVVDPNVMLDLMRSVHGDEHLQSHAGRNYLRDQLCRRYEWIRMTNDIANFKAACEKCATGRLVHLKKGTVL